MSGGVGGLLVGTLRTASPGPPITRDGAQRAAANELRKAIYHRDDPSLTQRVLDAVGRAVRDVFDAVSQHSPRGVLGVLATVGLVALVIAAIALRVGRPRRNATRRSAGLFADSTRSAQEHRNLADAHVQAGRWAEAVRERLRALARELEERAVLEPRTGRTADEMAAEAGRALPGAAADLQRASATFDRIFYGGHPASAADHAAVQAADDGVRDVRRLRDPVA